MGEDLKRRDKLFIVMFSLAALVMAVSNPDQMDIRSVGWDFALVIIFLSGFFWLLNEFGNQFSQFFYEVPVKSASKGKNRTELIELAGEISGIRKDVLNKMTDVELAGVIDSVSYANGVAATDSGIAPLHKIVIAAFKLAIRTIKAVIRIVVGTPKAIKNLPQTIKSKMSEIKKLWQEEMNQ